MPPRAHRHTGGALDWLRCVVLGSDATHSRVTPSVLSNNNEQSSKAVSEAVHVEPDALLPLPLGEAERSDATVTTPAAVLAVASIPSASHRPLSIDRRMPPALTMSRISHKSTRNLSQTALRKSTPHALSASHRRTIARMEFENGMRLIKRNIFSRKPWRDGIRVMAIVMSNTLTSLLIACGVAFVYALGSPLAPYYPTTVWSQAQVRSERNTAAFYGATGFYFALFGCIAYMIPAAVLASRRVVKFSKNRTVRPQGFRRSLLYAVRSSWHALVLTLGASTAFMLLMAIANVQLENVRFHLYVMSAIVYGYALYCDIKMRPLRRTRTQEIRKTLKPAVWSLAKARSVGPHAPAELHESSAAGVTPADHKSDPSVASTKSAEHQEPVVSSPITASLLDTLQNVRAQKQQHRTRMIQRVVMQIVVFSAVFVYLHIASRLRLVQQWELLLFAAVSLVFKISIQEAAKKFQLRCDSAAVNRKPSVRAIHLGMTVPTLAIDAQIRMVFIQNGGGQSIVASSIAIVFCEIFFRIAKILRLRYSITKRLAECKGMQRILKHFNSKLALRGVSSARAEYSEFLDWKTFVLRVHAAEVYADMHGEYISIGLSTAVIVFMGDSHPMFDLGAARAEPGQCVVAALFQIGTGLAFDYISSVVEGVHEVPLYESIADEGASLRCLLHVLLAALTAVNVGVIALFYLKSQ